MTDHSDPGGVGHPDEARLTFRDLIDANLSRVQRWHPGGLAEWSPLEWAGAMAGEAGEACNAAKKLKRIDGALANINHEPGRSLTDRQAACRQIAKEVADTIIYGALLVAAVGEDLPAVLAEVFNTKSQEYGFPERLPVPPPGAVPRDPEPDLPPDEPTTADLLRKIIHQFERGGFVAADRDINVPEWITAMRDRAERLDRRPPPGAVPAAPLTLALHRCRICGTRWLLWPDAIYGGGWNLLDKYSRPGACCDNAAMGEQIEHLRDIPLTANVQPAAVPAAQDARLTALRDQHLRSAQALEFGADSEHLLTGEHAARARFEARLHRAFASELSAEIVAASHPSRQEPPQ